MTAEVGKKKKRRGGHRLYLAGILPDVEASLEHYTVERKAELAKWKHTLNEQLEKIAPLDLEILALMGDDEKVTEEDMAREIDESSRLASDIKCKLAAIEELLTAPQIPQVQNVPQHQNSPPMQTGQASQHKSVRARLPKLEVRKFDGKVHEWQEFWDSFESAIHRNDMLENVDKFSYLRGLLVGPARSAIAGFALTSANYQAAVELLNKRYGKKEAIQRAYVNELLNVQPVYNERDAPRLRSLYDFLETKHRALQALGVDETTYSAIVVPSVLEKLPQTLRLTITRGKDHHQWNLRDLLEGLEQEVELREEYNDSARQKNSAGDFRRKNNVATLYAGNTRKAAKETNCAFCLGEHPHEDCRKVQDIEERKQLLFKYGRCFKCLRKGHLSKDCSDRSVTCKHCNCKHHSAICIASQGNLRTTEIGTQGAQGGAELVGNSMHVGTGNSVALQTAQAQLAGKGRARIRVLFDSASHKSFVTSRAVESFGLRSVRREWLTVNTFGQRATGSNLRDVVEIDLTPVGGGKVMRIEAFVVPEISRVQNEHLEIARKDYPHLAQIWLSDVCKGSEQLEIDVLIGADYLWSFQTGKIVRGEVDEPVAVETELGWVLSGPLTFKQPADRPQEVNVNFVGRDSVSLESLEGNVQRLWDLETLGIKESDGVYEEFVDSIAFNGNRYSVKLPWKEGQDSLPSNYELSLSRMKSQIRKLRKEPDILQEYDSVKKEQLDSGVIEKVAQLEETDRGHYIPHLAVIRREASTTKLRVVYDASAKAGKGGTSLNDCLHKGPSLNPLLFDILLRFREKRVALIGDIEKAFLNIEVDSADRDYLRFLWLENVRDPCSRIAVYRFCRVVFGLNASPFLLNATLRHHISKFKDEDPEFVRKMIEGFYVDDLVTGDSNTSDTYTLYEKSKQRMASGGFKLRKWMTNDKVLRERIAQIESNATESAIVTSEEESYAKFILGSGQASKSCPKVLGLPWDCEKDVIQFSFEKLASKALDMHPTKRSLLSLLASIFDPLGIISPIIVCMKILFQELCCENFDWDSKLEGKVKKKWDEWIEDLSKIRGITISRCIWDHPKQEVLNCYLHGFGDASNKAYCAVVYLVYNTPVGVFVRMLTSRSRVAPLKALTIPRLELMSARILAQLMNTVMKALETEVKLSGTRYWLDSKTALCWIRNGGEWKQFVHHRVNEILKLTKKEDWRYCPGEQNPADVGSRGALGSKLKDDELWWNGPQWLSEGEDRWPRVESVVSTPESEEEAKKTANVMVVDVQNQPSVANLVDINRHGRLEKLLRVTAWVFRFIRNSRPNRTETARRKGRLTREELVGAESEWVKAAQADLRSKGNFQQLKTELGLEESAGILRCTGRLVNSDLEFDARRPVILPRDHALSIMLIEECHKKVLHSGVRATLAELRSRYWIPKGRQCVKKVLSKCVICKKQEGKAYSAPQTAALPDFRVREAPAFSKVGVDFAGPLYVKAQAGGMRKAYIALFSCCVTRAIHLELVEDLSSEAFRRALRRFSARRGTPTLIVSDNAKTFQATEKALNNLFSHPEVASELDRQRIEWRFNLERSPWWGGFFERMVGSVKACLRKVLGNARLTFDELRTVLVEVEGTLNSRPLTYEYNEVEHEALTPSHLILGRRIKSMPDEIAEEPEANESSCSERFRYLTVKLAHFWKRWRNEYLVNLREFHRPKVDRKDRQIQIGDVVTVFEEGKKRGEWKIAVVESLIKGTDNVVRGANVRVIVKGRPMRISRPVQKLYPLEVKCAIQGNGQIGQTGNRKFERDHTTPLRRNPSRSAALDARWKSKHML